MSAVLIDCDTCEVRDVACDDCVVTVLLGPTRLGSDAPVYAGVVAFDEQERVALAVLADSGLVPPLRLVRTGERAAADPAGPAGQGPAQPSDHAV